MQDCERNKSKGEAAPPFSTLFTSFKPRQVILNSMSNINLHPKNGAKSLSAQQRKLLLRSICQFLDLNGFSKSLKKFHKEAEIEKESWKSCLLNLEEMCYQFLKLRDDARVSDCTNEKANGMLNGVASLEKEKEKEKEKGGDEGKKSQVEIHAVVDDDVKHKKKKKSKSASDSSAQIAEETSPKSSENPEDISLSVPNECEKNSKGKKKQRKDDSHDEKKEEKETLEKPDVVSHEEKKEKSKSKKKKEDKLIPNGLSVETTEVDKEKKSSKKRKKSSSDEIETDCAEKEALDDTKCRKIENLDQSNETILPKTPNGSANGVFEYSEKESHKKDTNKLNGSAEPRTSANAFRRVKEEEVEFVDERLQDNSYWAKDGADSGYGAKAQEVLGQVRGRDFRHEKTKKKRGSYRGGNIDLQSHSVKFNYDDDE